MSASRATPRDPDAEPELRDESGPAENAAEFAQAAREVASTVKPRLRGWLHLGMTPLTLAASIFLISLAPTTAGRISAAFFGTTAVLLFATSAIYHTGRWSPVTKGVLKRLDHANIFLIIAGSYTPFAVLLLEGSQRTALLTIAWTGALAGLLFRVFWTSASRWIYTPIYIALGWVAVFFLDEFWTRGGPAVTILLAAGGLLYTLGAVVYALKRPNPSPDWFGFHEIFHAFTVAAFSSHCVAV
nr:hemolysin III family protein [Actinomycetota bacterium]